MRTAVSLLAFLTLLSLIGSTRPLGSQEVKVEVIKTGEVKKVDVKEKAKGNEKKEAPLEEYDPVKADLETIQKGGLRNEAASLIGFFKARTIDDEQKKKIEGLIEKLDREEFDVREAATDELIRMGVGAVGMLRLAERNSDPEVLLRLQRCLTTIEKESVGLLSQAAARQIGRLKAEGAIPALLNYLPFVDDEVLAEEIRSTIALLAVKGGEADPLLSKSLQDTNPIRRGAAAEALGRAGDKKIRDQIRDFFNRETSMDVKFIVGLALLNSTKDKSLLPDLLKVMPNVASDRVYRLEEILYSLAGDTPPSVPGSNDPESRKQTSQAWLDWFAKNETKIDLSKLDDREKLLGFTLVMEIDNRGIGGRIIEVGPDGKERWKITNLQYPSDAQVLPGNRVIIAEHNNNRVSERDLTGKEIWAVQVIQPVNLQRINNGNTFVVGRAGLTEFDRNQKQVFTFNRPEFDIVAGAKMRNGEYLFMTQRGQIIRLDKEGKQSKVYNVQRIPYWGGMEVQANGKVLFTQNTAIAELDLNSGEVTEVVKYVNGSSCQRLPNGNVLVCGMNRMQVVELDRNGKTIWEYKSNDVNTRPWRSNRR